MEEAEKGRIKGLLEIICNIFKAIGNKKIYLWVNKLYALKHFFLGCKLESCDNIITTMHRLIESKGAAKQTHLLHSLWPFGNRIIGMIALTDTKSVEFLPLNLLTMLDEEEPIARYIYIH